jgi:hypothetical protein
VERLAAAEDGGGGRELGSELGVMAGGGFAGAGEQGREGRAAVEEACGLQAAVPMALLVDGDGDDFEALAVDGLEDRVGGEQRDLMLAGAAAEEDADAEFFLHDFSLVLGLAAVLLRLSPLPLCFVKS